jgi:hypothetical protein
MTVTIMNLLTHKAEELSMSHCLTEGEAGLLNKSSRLAAALGVTKFITIIAIYLVTLCCAT